MSDTWWDIFQKIEPFHISHYSLIPDFWKSIDSRYSYLKESTKWIRFKYLKNDSTLSDDIKLVSTTKGGVYIFVIKPEVIFDSMTILCYIGRAQYTDSMNLRSRIRQYMDYVNHPDKIERPKIRKLFRNWKEYIHCHCIELDSNEEIQELEIELVNKIIPPFNDLIFDPKISAAVKAFG